jgi:phosphoglycolate phosphatase
MSVRPVDAVLFDLDGTLLDTAPDLVFALNRALAEAGLPTCELEAVKHCVSGGLRAMLDFALAATAPDTDGLFCARPDFRLPAEDYERLLQRTLSLYGMNLTERTSYFVGMEEVLAALDALGLPWGIVTNKTRRFTDPLTAALNLTARTVCIVSGDTTPERKPHPLPLLEASRLLGLEPGRCVFIGDAAKDMEAGRRAGMATLAALYGYIGPDDEPHTWGADGALAQPLDLLDWLNGVNV